MAIIKHSDEVTIVTLSAASMEAGELDDMASAATMGLTGHYLLDMSRIKELTRDEVLLLSRVHYSLCLRGFKLVMYGVGPEVKRSFSKMGIASQFDFAADKESALRWVGAS